MNDKTFENKVNRDVDNVKKDLDTLGDDGVTGLSSKFEQFSDQTKEKVSDAVKTLNKDVGHGLSIYNAKVQNIADRLPGDFGRKAASYPWVTITMSLAFSLVLGLGLGVLGVLLKPGRQPVG